VYRGKKKIKESCTESFIEGGVVIFGFSALAILLEWISGFRAKKRLLGRFGAHCGLRIFFFFAFVLTLVATPGVGGGLGFSVFQFWIFFRMIFPFLCDFGLYCGLRIFSFFAFA